MKTLAILLAAGCAVAARPAAAAEPASGAQLYAQWCGYCHDPVSPHQPQLAGTYTLEQRYKGRKPAALVERTDLSADFVKTIVRQGLNVMPRFRKTEITDAQLDEIAAFLARSK